MKYSFHFCKGTFASLSVIVTGSYGRCFLREGYVQEITLTSWGLELENMSSLHKNKGHNFSLALLAGISYITLYGNKLSTVKES